MKKDNSKNNDYGRIAIAIIILLVISLLLWGRFIFIMDLTTVMKLAITVFVVWFVLFQRDILSGHTNEDVTIDDLQKSQDSKTKSLTKKVKKTKKKV